MHAPPHFSASLVLFALALLAGCAGDAPSNSSCAVDNGGCDVLVTCDDNADGVVCGACPDGYSGDGHSGCDDIDECGQGNGGCDPLVACVNTAGGHVCGDCPSGTVDVNDDGSTCDDVDECAEGDHDCDGLTSCINDLGSYHCAPCPSGYDDVHGDGTRCDDIDECTEQTDTCSDLVVCTNTDGSYSCGDCPEGYADDGDGGCTDRDECDEAVDDCDQQCTNTDGGFACACESGWTLADDDRTCLDLDECATNNGGCGDAEYSRCVNNTGSAPTCEDIDECATDNGGCGAQEYVTCHNVASAPPTCDDIDECQTNNGNCGPEAAYTCVNEHAAPPTCERSGTHAELGVSLDAAPAPDLALPPRATEPLELVVTVHYDNDIAAVETSLTLQLPDGLLYDVGSAGSLSPGWEVPQPYREQPYDEGRVTWSVERGTALTHATDTPGTLPAGQGEVSLRLVAWVQPWVAPGTTLQACAEVQTVVSQYGEQPDNACHTVSTARPDPFVDLQVQSPVVSGGPLTYTLQFGNAGREPCDTQVITLQVPDVDGDGVPDISFTSTSPAPGDVVYFHTAPVNRAAPALDPANPGATGWTSAPGAPVAWLAVVDRCEASASDLHTHWSAISPMDGRAVPAGSELTACVDGSQFEPSVFGDGDPDNNALCLSTTVQAP